MNQFELRIALIDGAPHVVYGDVPAPEDHLTFTLNRKALKLNGIEFEQWWMNQKSVYPTRNRKAGNFNALLNYWWQSCVAHQSNISDSVCESLLLANLLPKTRSNGSRRVLLDSVLKAGKKSDRKLKLDNLENMLSMTFEDEKSILEFSRDTGRMLGPPDFPKEISSAYKAFTGELLQPAVQELQSGDLSRAHSLANKSWLSWQKKFGRRANKKDEKLAIDMVSYEARAAVHRCYSHAWEAITNWIVMNQEDSGESFVFHRLWHLDLFWPSEEYGDRSFHLFHGHILGLHPATNLFIQTPTGKRLLANWLNVTSSGWEFSSKPESPELRRLLNGLLIAVNDYVIHHSDSNFERSSKSARVPSALLDSSEVESALA